MNKISKDQDNDFDSKLKILDAQKSSMDIDAILEYWKKLTLGKNKNFFNCYFDIEDLFTENEIEQLRNKKKLPETDKEPEKMVSHTIDCSRALKKRKNRRNRKSTPMKHQVSDENKENNSDEQSLYLQIKKIFDQNMSFLDIDSFDFGNSITNSKSSTESEPSLKELVESRRKTIFKGAKELKLAVENDNQNILHPNLNSIGTKYREKEIGIFLDNLTYEQEKSMRRTYREINEKKNELFHKRARFENWLDHHNLRNIYRERNIFIEDRVAELIEKLPEKKKIQIDRNSRREKIRKTFKFRYPDVYKDYAERLDEARYDPETSEMEKNVKMRDLFREIKSRLIREGRVIEKNAS